MQLIIYATNQEHVLVFTLKLHLDSAFWFLRVLSLSYDLPDDYNMHVWKHYATFLHSMTNHLNKISLALLHWKKS